MSRRNWTRLIRIEEVIASRRPPEPWVVLFPGQDPPEGFTGNLVQIGVFDGRKQPVAEPLAG